MDYFFQIANYLYTLSNQADKIRNLDQDHYGSYSDMQIMQELIDDKIDELKKRLGMR